MSFDPRVRKTLQAFAPVTVLDEQRPQLVEIGGKRYSFHISPIHDSGENRPNDDEQRIQANEKALDTQKLRNKNGTQPVFLGLFDSVDVFTAWEPTHAMSFKGNTNFSVYARLSQASRVLSVGSATREIRSNNLGRSTYSVSLPLVKLYAYLIMIGQVHLPNNTSRILSTI